MKNNAKSEQQPVKERTARKKVLSPVRSEIDTQKADFIEALKQSGLVSDALESSGLERAAAYEHFSTDEKFAARWVEALEISNDELIREARSRAIRAQGSDRLLIYLLNQAERQQKWRNRVIQTGNIALETVAAIGKARGIPDAVIGEIQTAMTEKFRRIPLT